MQKVNNILVTAPSWVGDAVMATPSFRCIRENFPDANITLLLKPYVKEILGGAPWFDQVIEHDTKDKHKQAGKYLSLIRKLRKTKYDLAFVLPNSFSSALITWSAGAIRRIGYVRDNRAWLLTDAVQRPKENGRFLPTYMGDYYLRLCTSIGCKVGSEKTEIFVSPESGKKIEQLFSKHGLTSSSRPKVLINPGATYGSSKFWTADGFAETAKLLRKQKDCDVLLVTSPDEKDIANKIVDASDGNIVNLSEDCITLELLKALVDKCSLLITVDSGPRHLAVALNKPVVTLIGPTDPRYTRTKQEIGKVVRSPVDCAPCHLKICPTDHRCMEQIKPQKVVAAAIELLSKRKARARKQ